MSYFGQNSQLQSALIPDLPLVERFHLYARQILSEHTSHTPGSFREYGVVLMTCRLTTLYPRPIYIEFDRNNEYFTEPREISFCQSFEKTSGTVS